jgi:hypothetical protein
MAQNLEAWELANRFAGMFRADPFTGRRAVDYAAARWIATETALPDFLHFLEQLEAVVRGINAAFAK